RICTPIPFPMCY
uniref:Tigerinin-1O n=1 Tax=Hoplobatrachus occipitalis TaxID=127645 RepID=TIN1O_HOPOC|nr:RecName: Full=Tigerinin-1O [Hoplobatrachus occipitalis]